MQARKSDTRSSEAERALVERERNQSRRRDYARRLELYYRRKSRDVS